MRTHVFVFASAQVMAISSHKKRNSFRGRRIFGEEEQQQPEQYNSTNSSDNLENSLKLIGKCGGRNRLCQLCEGDCHADVDCADGLACFIRDSRTPSQTLPVPGCSNNPPNLFAKDFCYNMTLAPCGDVNNFVDNDNMEKSCLWVVEGGKAEKRERCGLYGHFCRQTCGYCRLRPRDIN